MDSSPSTCHAKVPRWLHLWAIVTACCALPLVALGAEVTTKSVGMVDQEGFRAPWHLFTLPLRELGLGYLIEHGHRLAGFVVGICSIVLALTTTLFARGWYRCLGWAALVAVSAQGILGILRVNKNVEAGPELALLHGCTAQLVFAVLALVVVFTSRTWFTPITIDPGTRRLAVAIPVLVYVQIVFGASLRHLLDPLAQRLHVLLALAVLIAFVWLVRTLWEQCTDGPSRRLAIVLCVLFLIQPVLGVEAMVRRFGAFTYPDLLPSSATLDFIRSSHHVLGTLIFCLTVSLAALLCRPARREQLPVIVPAPPLEGAA